MQTNELPMTINHRNIYSDFFSRLGAGLLDGLIMCPIWMTSLFSSSLGVNMQLFMQVLIVVFGAFYMIYFPKRFGGTPGKLIAGLKIVKMDGSDIDWIAAFNRYSVSLTLGFLTTAGTVYALMQADPETYESMSWLEKSQYLQSFNATYNMIFTWILGAWTLVDIIIFFTNDRRRALHDMIGGTVVIKKIYDEKVKALLSGESENPHDDTSEITA